MRKPWVGNTPSVTDQQVLSFFGRFPKEEGILRERGLNN
jgi:hypothetical protein